MVDYYNVTFHTNPVGGSINVQYGVFTDGMVIGFTEGTYDIRGNPPTGMSFKSWTVSGGIEIIPGIIYPTAMHVTGTGPGTLQANWETGPPPTGRQGYSTMTVKNTRTGVVWTTTGSGCPPVSGQCVGPINLYLNDILHIDGYVKKCDGTGWTHTELGEQVIRIKSGACGDPGEDFDLAIGHTQAGIYGSSYYTFDITVTQAIFDWITRQQGKGYRASIYQQASIDLFGWYSSEIVLIGLTPPPPPPPPPPVPTCDSIPHGLLANIWDNIAWGFCVALQPGLTYLKWLIDNTEFIWQPIVTAIGNIKITGFPTIPDLEKWFRDSLTLVTSGLEWFTNPVGKAFGLAAQVGEDLGAALSQVIKVVDPLAGLFNPDRFETDEVKGIAGRIHGVISRGEFGIFELIEAYILAPWGILFIALEALLVPEGEISYDEGARRGTRLIALSADVSILMLAFDAILGLMPRGVRIMDNMVSGMRELLAGLLTIGSVSTVFGPAIDASIKVPLAREWRTRTRGERPSLSQYLSMRAEGLITKERYGQGLAELGLPDEWHERLYGEYLDDISFRDLVTLKRRGIITQGKLDELLEVARRDPQWLTYWHELLYDDPTFRMLNTMATQGQLTERELSDAITRLGLPDPYKTKLLSTLMDAFGRTERRRVLTLFARRVAQEGATEEAYYALADGYKTPREIASLLLQAERLRIAAGEDVTEREATKGMFDAWYKVDIIDATTYRTGLLALGYDAETITRELTRLDLVAPTGERETTASEALRAYRLKLLTEAQLRTILERLGRTDDAIDLIIETENAPPEPPTEREVTRSMWDTWYMEDIVSADQYRTALAELRYPADDITRQLALLDKRKAPAPPPPEKIAEATRAMYDTFYMEDIIDAAAWRAFYVTQKYTPDVIGLQLTYLDKKKAPPVVPPEPLPEERDLLQSEALAAFKKHVIDESTLRDRLDKLGRSDDAINVLVAIAKADMAVEQRDATLAVYAQAYRQGALLRSDYKAKLLDNQYTDEAADLIIQTQELSWSTGIETLTQSQILNAWEEGFLTDEKVWIRLRALGLADTDSRILLANSVLDQLKAKLITNAEADKKWLDLAIEEVTRQNLLRRYGWST